jgi:hypothetical protein
MFLSQCTGKNTLGSILERMVPFYQDEDPESDIEPFIDALLRLKIIYMK